MTSELNESAALNVAGTAHADDLAESAWLAARSLVLDLYDRRAEVTEALGMSFIRAKALLKLTGGPMTMRELAAALATDPPYTSVVVDDLHQRGLLERTVHPSDRRAKVVTITPAGRKTAKAASLIINEPPPALRSLSVDDLKALNRILSQLLDS
ncbi:MarR family winged helix-turn-helix transcriptional regulator [Jatrophihabitans sp. DSM 45814]